MSARERRAVREGEAHAASKTSKSNTPESFLVGVGASGALLAGAAIVFVTLVGLVSFNVWPTGQALSLDGNVELSGPTPNSTPSHAAAPVSAASGLIASTTAGSGSTVGGGTTGAGSGQGGGKDKSGRDKPKSGVTNPPAATPPATDNVPDTGGGGSTPSTPGSGSKSPTHPIHPAHPEGPHQDVSDGSKGTDQGSQDESGDAVTGKGPFVRPTPPSSPTNSSDSNTNNGNGNGDGHRSPRFRH